MKRTIKPLLTMSLCASLSVPLLANGDDIDIFTGASAGTNGNPRILIVLDNTSNWSRQSQQWPGGSNQGQSEANAIRSVLTGLDSSVNLGLMEFVTGGNANQDGGFVRFAIKEMNATNKAAFTTTLNTIAANTNDPDEKKNSGTPYGNLMYDVYNYFSGGLSYSPGGVIASKADIAGYASAYTRFASPINALNNCGRNFVIFIGNPGSSGPSTDSATNTAALNALSSAAGTATPITQLGLPGFTSETITTTGIVGTTGACYASAAAATAGLSAYSASCAAYSEGCSIGAATSLATPISCPTDTQTYTVTQSVFTPASTTTTTSTTSGPVVTTAPSTGYYSSAGAVPSSDRGGLTCPANTASTTYSCTYTVGDAHNFSAPHTNTGRTTSCYSGLGTGNHEWDSTANPPSDLGTGTNAVPACPANASCNYTGSALLGSVPSGVSCTGQRKPVSIKQNVTPTNRYIISRSVTTTTTSTSGTPTPASTATNVLGMTSACYASAPTSTSDYSASCTGTNISCSYAAPTSTTIASCPSGQSAYQVVGTNIEITNVPNTTSTTDTNTFNADEWARFMHDDGIAVTGLTTRPQVTTYTIDVYNAQQSAAHTSLFLSMAKAGGGKYFAAKNEQAIIDAIKTILVEIQAVNTAFASTSLPVNATNRSQNENQVFIGMFRPDPDAKPRWFGNLKRYQLVTSGSSIELGDVNGALAVNSQTGFVTPCAKSYWTGDSGAYWNGLGINPSPETTCTTTAFNTYSDAPDGPQVEKGAAAQILRQGNAVGAASTSRVLNRNIKTLSGSTLVDFNVANSGLASSLVEFIRGADVNLEKGVDPTLTRPSIHGDVIHSRPQPVNYGGATGVTVYYGANDGTLHAVDATSGVERWSFVAPEFFPRLQRLKDNSPKVAYPGLSAAIVPTPTKKDYFWDGSLGLYQKRDNSRVWIYPSMRRGGRMVYGLDVTNPATPAFKWKLGCPNLTNDTGCTTGMEDMGQSWSTPTVAFIKGYSTTSPVVIFGGGYDSCEDTDSTTPSCGSTKGGKVYIVDADTGALIRSFTTARGVAADVGLIDINNDTFVDYAYVADLGGAIYRIDFVNTSGVMQASADWASRSVAYTTGGGRKFQFAPALAYSGGKVYVAIGSGNREHPLETQHPYISVTNRFYVYKDDLAAALPIVALDMDTGLEDYTTNNSCATPSVFPTSSLKGWYINLNQHGRGEQTVTSALIAGGMVAFSTNRPVPASVGTCSTSLGEAGGYWVSLFNGSGSIGVDGTCGGTRRSVFVGGGLPPSPVLATGIPVDGNYVSVVIGAVQKSGVGANVTIGAQKIQPSPRPNRKKVYSHTGVD